MPVLKIDQVTLPAGRRWAQGACGAPIIHAACCRSNQALVIIRTELASLRSRAGISRLGHPLNCDLVVHLPPKVQRGSSGSDGETGAELAREMPQRSRFKYDVLSRTDLGFTASQIP